LQEKTFYRRIKATIGGLIMSRSYQHVKAIEKEVFGMKDEGKSNREIREYFGISKVQLRNLITRHNQKVKQFSAQTIPKHRGRPRQKPITIQREAEIEIKQLKMENELLRDFLHLVGRK